MLKELPYEGLLFVAVLMFGIHFFYAIKGIKKRFLSLFFQMAMFTFLLARPVIEFLHGVGLENLPESFIEGKKIVLGLLILVEISLFLGMVLCEKYGSRLVDRISTITGEYGTDFRQNLQRVALCVCVVTLGLYVVQQIEPLLVIGTHNYLAYYTSFQSKLPGIVHTIASFMKYSLCIYLATLPKKRSAFVMLLIYVLSTVPSLLIGIRNPFVLSLLFSLTYYMLRDFLEQKNVWIGKLEKILICVGIPLGIIAMVVYSFSRMGGSIAIRNPLSLLANFFYSQGITFDVAVVGTTYGTELADICPVNYTFGGIIDYVYRGTIGQALFGTLPLTPGNSEFNALNGNSLAHALSYLANRESYLSGTGLGSTFVLETYIDFGYIGVMLFSFILGGLLVLMSQAFGKRILLSTIILYALTNIFFMPRAEATGWLTFVITIQFWACVVCCYLAAYICTRWRIFENIFKKRI